jgi:hypothetical protein
VPVSFSGMGTYSKNGGAYTSSAGTAVLGDTFTMRLTSNGSGGIATSGTLTIGGVSDTYTVTTKIGDTTPDPFTFTDLAAQACNTDILSNVLIVTGVESTYSATLSLSGTGTYWRKNGGSWFAAGIGGAVQTNDTVQLKIVTDNTLNKTWTANINIGGVPDSWVVVTGNSPEPTPYTFTDITGAARSTEYISNAITISGLTPGYRAPVVCAALPEYSPRVRINGSTIITTGVFGSAANGDTVEAMLISHANPASASGIEVRVGSGAYSDIWYITTA